MGLAAGLIELVGVAVSVLGVFVAWGPYQDDRTQNLMRNRARHEVVDVPSQEPTHFRLRELFPMTDAMNSPIEEERKLGLRAWRRKSPPVLFLHGHCGKWLQVINIAVYTNYLSNTSRPAAAFFATDFHASASALHSSVVRQQAAFAAAAMLRISELYAEAGAPRQALTLIGHSMGGLVALEALRLLGSERSQGLVNIGAVVLICTPLLGHPLLLEQGMHDLSSQIRRELWPMVFRDGAAPMPPVLALAAGDTDPLVPSEVAALPRGTSSTLSSNWCTQLWTVSCSLRWLTSSTLRSSRCFVGLRCSWALERWSMRGGGLRSPWKMVHSAPRNSPWILCARQLGRANRRLLCTGRTWTQVSPMCCPCPRDLLCSRS
mmetsp:Transcript_16852/g.54448  ORF Transcript_16852/g.54448 Transcript_16852/m.54448 type:complete len:376 (-) Transcript_16852:1944-3071(-)